MLRTLRVVSTQAPAAYGATLVQRVCRIAHGKGALYGFVIPR
jgi:hypothetical protein